MADELTGLETHTAFPAVHLPTVGREAIAFDVAGLIRVNDQFGFEQGHTTLRSIASLLSELVTEFGGQLYRYAGDEFLWILAADCSSSPRNLAEIALRQCAELRLPFRATNSTRDCVLLNAALLRLVPGDLDEPSRLRDRIADCIYAAKVRDGVDYNLVASEQATPIS